jgi:hypothetical protein
LKNKLIIASVVLVLCIVLAGICWFVTRDKRAVINMVQELSGTLYLKSGRQAHEGALKHQKVGEFFADNISVRVVDPELSLDVTNEALVQNAALFFRYADSLEVKTQDISAEVAGSEATFSCDAEIHCTVKNGRGEMNGVYRISGSAKKIDGNWKISSIVIEPIVK